MELQQANRNKGDKETLELESPERTKWKALFWIVTIRATTNQKCVRNYALLFKTRSESTLTILQNIKSNVQWKELQIIRQRDRPHYRQPLEYQESSYRNTLHKVGDGHTGRIYDCKPHSDSKRAEDPAQNQLS